MKFPQLPIGARFEFEGKTYVKTNTLLASADSGDGQRIIPRWAILKPLDGVKPATPRPPPSQIDLATAIAALDTLHAACLEQLDGVADEPGQLNAAKDALNAAKDRLLAQLQPPRE